MIVSNIETNKLIFTKWHNLWVIRKPNELDGNKICA